MKENGNDTIFDAVFGLFEWTFETPLTAQGKAAIENQVLRGWDNGDRTDHELVAYLLQLHDMIWGVSQNNRDPLRQQARDIFRREFAKADSTDRGRILTAIHQVLEGAARGVTGVSAGSARSRLPVPRLTVPGNVAPPAVVVAPPAPSRSFAGVPGQPASLGGMKNQLLQQQLDAYSEAEMITLESNIAALKHEMKMAVARNIK